MKMLIFHPPNNPTPSENGRRDLKKQRGLKGSFVRVIKRPLLLIFTSFVCYLRQLYFAMYTESNFSYSEKSLSATYAHLFNTEKNRSSTEKLRLWIVQVFRTITAKEAVPQLHRVKLGCYLEKNYCEVCKLLQIQIQTLPLGILLSKEKTSHKNNESL